MIDLGIFKSQGAPWPPFLHTSKRPMKYLVNRPIETLECFKK